MSAHCFTCNQRLRRDGHVRDDVCLGESVSAEEDRYRYIFIQRGPRELETGYLTRHSIFQSTSVTGDIPSIIGRRGVYTCSAVILEDRKLRIIRKARYAPRNFGRAKLTHARGEKFLRSETAEIE